MNQKKTTFYRKIAALLCFVFCLQCLSPVADVFADGTAGSQYTTNETETHNKATQTLGSYSTSGYKIKDPVTKAEVIVPVSKEVETMGDKVLTTNKLDMDWIRENEEDLGIDLDNFIVDGQYKFDAEIQYDIVIDNKGTTVSVVGQEDMLSAPQDYWGGSWSQNTINNIKGTNGNSIVEGTYYYDLTPVPTNTPVPTFTPTPKPTATPIPTDAPIPGPEIEDIGDLIITPIPEYTVSIICIPEEGGSATGDGNYNPGDSVSVSASANKGYELDHMTRVSTGDKISSSSMSFLMPEHHEWILVYFNKTGGATPAPTTTPQPTSTPTPIPTPLPETYHYYPSYEYVEYGSTTNGYSISDITVNGKIANETGANAVSLADEIAAVGTRTAYNVGVDADGNEWYFGDSNTRAYVQSAGSTVYIAKSVHPKTYNGHAVDSSAVRFINELVFPEYITYNGRTYYVYTIGGSGPYYYSAADASPSGTVSSSHGTIKGEYSWESGTNSSAFSYELGVMGNGTITSSGTTQISYTDYDTYVYHTTYRHDYHIYNTTLASVTIPASCVTIEDYAFRNCQALTSINIASGGSYLATVGTHSFSVAEIPALQRSRIYSYSSKYITYKIEKIYSYNGSYVVKYSTPFNESMKEFQRQLEISSYMDWPAFYKLKTIGESAFENRSHLEAVSLSGTVATIHRNAFKNCKLEKISVPNRNCVVNGDYHTLGTKGCDYMKKTLIITPENSKAYVYGTTWNDYYMLSPNIYINYFPNGGTPASPQTLPASAEYKSVKWSGQMASSENYVVWVDEEYNVYWAKKNGNKISGKVQTGLTGYKFVEIEYFNREYFLATTKSGVTYVLTASGSGISVADCTSQNTTAIGRTLRFDYSKDSNGYDTSEDYISEWYFNFKDNSLRVSYNEYRKNYDGTYDDYTDYEDTINVDGTYLGALGEKASYYYNSTKDTLSVVFLSDDGYLQAVDVSLEYGASLSHMSDIQFTKCVVVSSPELYSYGGEGNYYCSAATDYCQGHEYNDNRYNSATYHELFLAGLGTDGHLYCITRYKTSNDSYYRTTVTQYDDKEYSDILCCHGESTSDNSHTNNYGTKDSHGHYPYSVTYDEEETTITSYFYALGTDNKVYGFNQVISNTSDETDTTTYVYCDSDGNITSTPHSVTGSEITTIYNITDFNLTLRDYVNVSHNHANCDSSCVPNNVGKFLNYPFFQFAPGEIGYFPSLSMPLDIDAGVIVHYDISENLWFEKEGCDFTVWNTAKNGTGTAYVPGKRYSVPTVSSSSTTYLDLYAQWAAAAPKPKYVYYDANGGYGTMEATVIPAGSNSFTVATNAFSKSGHSFKGYFTENADGSGTRYEPGQTYTTEKNKIILYAQWEPYTYTVSFAYDDIRVKPEYIWDTITLAFDQSIGMPKEPFEKKCVINYDLNTNSSMSTAASAKWTTAYPFSEEYTTVYMKFKGWHKYQNTPEGYKDKRRIYEEYAEVSGLSTVNGDHLTMFPEWGGVESYVCLPGASCNGYELYGYMDAPVKEYATEVAGYVYENGGGLYLPRASETLYAWWEPLQYEVNLVSAYEGNPPDTAGDTSVTMTFDAVCPEVTAPALEHYVFMGYYTQPKGQGEQYYGKADNAAGIASAYENKLWQIYDGSVTTLYAYWIPDKEIRYEPNYAPLEADCKEAWSEFIETEDNYWTLAENEFTRTGYHFAGWNTVADGSGTAYADKEAVETASIDGVVPLYAQWEPNKYSVQYAPDEIGEDPVIPTPGPEDMWEHDKEYTISGQPYVKYDKVSYELNRADKSTEPYMVTDLKDEHTKSVYRFIGWQLYEKTASGYNKLSGLFAEGEAVMNLTAEQGKAYVLFPVWKEVPEGVTLPRAASTGYIFHGWTEKQTADSMLGTGNVLTNPYITKRTADGTYSMVDGHKVFHASLYAYWTPKEYDVVLDDRGATSTGHTESVHMTFDELGPDIIVPEKNGYTFQGYYTGIRGTGKKYYDSTGTCVKPWTEDNVYVLFACWVQEKAELPDIGDRTLPEELPELDVEGSVGRTDGKGLIYADDYNPATDALTDLQPYLAYDTPGSEGAIPGTEAVAFRAKMGSWMLSYKFHRYSGTDYVRVYVAVPYRTQYEESESEKLVISPVQTRTYSFMVPKAWSYWEVLESGMYYPDKVEVYNEALKDGTLTVKVDREGGGAVETPDYAVVNHGEKENHVFWTDHDTDGTPVLYIILTDIEYIISNVPDTLPDIDKHLKIVCENAAWEDKRQASVKSDSFMFDGEILLSDELNADGNGSSLQEEKLPAGEEAVEFTSYLQTYVSGVELDEHKPNDTYATRAVITYKGDESNVGAAATEEVEITAINSLKIHTPVACEGVAVDGIEDGVITLKNALNFFTLRIDNTGTHRMSLGYGTKDFSMALSGKSNVADKNGSYLNQVHFPFDVYVDVGNNSLKEGGTYDTTGDYYFAAGTWFTMGMEEQRFYIPVTQKNGTYQIEFRTISINCPKHADGEYQVTGVAQDKVNRIKSNYVATDEIEIQVKSYLKDFIITDTNDPTALLQLAEGYQALTLKKGYEFSYQLLTQGEFYGDKSEIEVIPTYFWVSEDEAERQEVELYRMVKLPDKEWKECYAWEEEPLLEQYPNGNVILQRWGGSGFVPEEVLCIEKGNIDLEEYMSMQTITGKESFFKQNGYLVIHFEIKVKSEENVWYEFTGWNETKLAKDALAAGWNYVPGDVIRYDLSKSIADDYEVGGVE